MRDPFLDGRVWRTASFDGPGAVARARAAAALAVGPPHFSAFPSTADKRASNTRTVRALGGTEDPTDARLLRVDVEGDAFLHTMVRILVGTLADVARGRLAPGAVARALASGDRRDAGITAHAGRGGLSLEQVLLDDEGAEAWPPVIILSGTRQSQASASLTVAECWRRRRAPRRTYATVKGADAPGMARAPASLASLSFPRRK